MSRSIYGIRNDADNLCNCIPEVSPTVGLNTLLDIVKRLKSIIDRLYDPMIAVSNVEGSMSMTGSVTTPVFVRLRWVKLHSGEKFNKYSYKHVCGIDGLMWIYTTMGREWREDPMFLNPDYVIPTNPNT